MNKQIELELRQVEEWIPFSDLPMVPLGPLVAAQVVVPRVATKWLVAGLVEPKRVVKARLTSTKATFHGVR